MASEFTDAYCRGVVARLNSAHNEREGSKGRAQLLHTADAMLVVWEPGDMTRYEMIAVMVPEAGCPDVVCCGTTTFYGPWYFRQSTGGFLHTSYFKSKNPRFDPGEYTIRKIVQMVAAVMDMTTDANDPPNYGEEG